VAQKKKIEEKKKKSKEAERVGRGGDLFWKKMTIIEKEGPVQAFFSFNFVTLSSLSFFNCLFFLNFFLIFSFFLS